ncbi:hypothetical protein HGA34_04670 [Candidatus Falkowbacteria bacterium]|nr:hypothetical protein [Candidatus Falkowbacteria bacterium]
MSNQLEKALALCKKTGDRIIVFESPQAENPFVLMNLTDYEKIAVSGSEVRGLTEAELLDKINRDIALWKSEQETLESTDSAVDFLASIKEDMPLSDESATPESKRSQWAIKDEVKNAAEEVIEEDRQYLETVTY